MTPRDNSFVHLHVHSEYSMLDGAARVKPLIAEAVAQGMPAIAVTDHGKHRVNRHHAAYDKGDGQQAQKGHRDDQHKPQQRRGARDEGAKQPGGLSHATLLNRAGGKDAGARTAGE